MSSTFSPLLRLELQADGENSGTWGQKVNNDLQLLEQSISGWTQVNPTGNTTLTHLNGVTDQSRCASIQLGASGAPVGAYNITIPAAAKQYLFDNQSGQTATVTTGSGGTVSIPAGARVTLYCDGVNVASQFNSIPVNTTIAGTLGVSGATTLSGPLALSGTLTTTAAINESPFITVTAAATTDIGAVASNNVLLTGVIAAGGVTSLGTFINGARRFVLCGSVVTLTNSASLILPGGANIVTAVGDTAIFVSTASAWICIGYTRATGLPLSNIIGTANSWTAANAWAATSTFNAPAAFNKQTSTPFITAAVAAGQLSLDFSAGNNFDVAPGGAAFVLALPTNLLPGQSGLIRFVGAGTITYASGWFSAGGGRPALSGANDFLAYTVFTSGFIVFSMLTAVA